MRGTIELSDTYIGSVYDPRLDLMSVPYLTTGWEDLAKLYTPGGFVFEALGEIGRELGYETLSFVALDYIGLGTAKPVPSPADPDIEKGLKIRVWPAKPPELLMKRLGFLPTAIPWAEAPGAMQMGVIDGIFGAGCVSAYEVLRDVIDYWIHYRAMFDAYFYIMNRDLLNSLSSEDQKIVMDAAIEQQNILLAAAEQKEVEYLQKLRDYGIEVITFTPAEMDTLGKAVKADVWPELESLVGKKLMDGALEALK
jgi:TRAP-type C4-dicarboxylate transport system substrate-binding protein